MLQRLISISPSPSDGRSRLVALTEEGRSLFKRTAPLWQEAQRQFEQLNGTENVASLRKDLAQVKVGDVSGIPDE